MLDDLLAGWPTQRGRVANQAGCPRAASFGANLGYFLVAGAPISAPVSRCGICLGGPLNLLLLEWGSFRRSLHQ